jgi:hypothetical protein
VITADDLHRAIRKSDPRLLTGQRGFVLIENLPRIAMALSIQIGACCNDCGNDLPDDACLLDGRMLCGACYAKGIGDADKAVPTDPFMGGGQRVIRKTGGLS